MSVTVVSTGQIESSFATAALGLLPPTHKRPKSTAQAILDACALYPDCSLVVLYDEVIMPSEFRKAHQDSDRAIMAAYGFLRQGYDREQMRSGTDEDVSEISLIKLPSLCSAFCCHKNATAECCTIRRIVLNSTISQYPLFNQMEVQSRMAQDNCQKIKLLKLLELLRHETDEQNPMTTMTIIDRLSSMGISCERRTLAKDIALLNERGYEVMTCWVNKEKGYYVEDRSFSVPELKILIDAVQAASFITSRKTSEMIDKIAALGGSHRADVLRSNLVQFNTRKHTNESIFYTVGTLETALQEHRKVIFRYFDLNENNERVFRREGHHYVVEPVSLVFNEDNYYLVCYSPKHDDTSSYRVDRMESVEVIDEGVSETALRLRAKVGEFTGQAIKMFGGEQVDVVLEFDRSLIGAFYDRFGEKTKMIASAEKCVATVKVQVSPTFLGWIFQFGTGMRIISPDSVVRAFDEKVKSLIAPEQKPTLS